MGSATRPGRMNVTDNRTNTGDGYRNVTPALLKNRYPTSEWNSRFYEAVWSWR